MKENLKMIRSMEMELLLLKKYLGMEVLQLIPTGIKNGKMELSFQSIK